MARTRIKWKVAEPHTGRYRSFLRRGWPSGEIGGKTAFSLHCADEYVPRLVREGKHREITVCVAVYNLKTSGFTWRYVKHRAATLDEAKAIAQRFADEYPEVFVNAPDDE